jgi:hypothetical protein
MDCILAVYFSQILIAILGIIILVFMGMVVTDAPVDPPENAQSDKRHLPKPAIIREPLIKIIEFVFYRIPMQRKIRAALLISGGLLLLIGISWLVINQIQKPIVSLMKNHHLAQAIADVGLYEFR